MFGVLFAVGWPAVFGLRTRRGIVALSLVSLFALHWRFEGLRWQMVPIYLIALGLAVTDLTSGYIRYSGGYSESILPTVKPGVLMTHVIDDFTARLAVSGDIKFEGRRGAAQFWLKDLSLDTHWGLEISYKEMLFGRAGFDIGNLTAGLGIDIKRITVDLAYLHNDFLDETFRVSAGYRF